MSPFCVNEVRGRSAVTPITEVLAFFASRPMPLELRYMVNVYQLRLSSDHTFAFYSLIDRKFSKTFRGCFGFGKLFTDPCRFEIMEYVSGKFIRADIYDNFNWSDSCVIDLYL